MAMEIVVQRLQLGDVILVDIPEQGGEVEATVAREPVRTESTVRVMLLAEGSNDFVVREWALGDLVTVVRGP